MTPAEIEPATFRFVAQHLNHCATAVLRVVEVTCVANTGGKLCSVLFVCEKVNLISEKSNSCLHLITSYEDIYIYIYIYITDRLPREFLFHNVISCSADS